MSDRQGVIPTRIVCISDTHKSPLRDAGDTQCAFRKPLPFCDVLIHAGDLTASGGLAAHEITFDVLASSPAPLKLVIAGNHDKDLDRPYWQQTSRSFRFASNDEEYKAAIAIADVQVDAARELWTGANAKLNNIHFLDEGMHHFKLGNGAELTVYATPYTPEFCGWAFAYPRDVDRFNPTDEMEPGPPGAAAMKPVPDFPAVDIMLTHGPPAGVLDEVRHGGEHVGCAALWDAVKRARPRMHVFGHIHEQWGMERMNWVSSTKESIQTPDMEQVRRTGWASFNGTGKEGGAASGDQAESGECDAQCRFPLATTDEALQWGKNTLFVNASIMDLEYRPRNAPWIIDLLLPIAKAKGHEKGV